jgi:hypothetical protein
MTTIQIQAKPRMTMRGLGLDSALGFDGCILSDE